MRGALAARESTARRPRATTARARETRARARGTTDAGESGG